MHTKTVGTLKTTHGKHVQLKEPMLEVCTYVNEKLYDPSFIDYDESKIKCNYFSEGEKKKKKKKTTTTNKIIETSQE